MLNRQALIARACDQLIELADGGAVHCSRDAVLLTDNNGGYCLACIQGSKLAPADVAASTDEARRELAKVWGALALDAARVVARTPSVVDTQRLLDAARNAAEFALPAKSESEAA